MNSDSGAHLVSISHDPMEDGDQAPRYRGRDDRPTRGLASYSSPADWSSDRHTMRPLLLAGALGLFAAWAVSGMNLPSFGSAERPRRPGDRPRPDLRRSGYDAPRRAVVGGQRRGLPPEGESSRDEFALDAMNP